MFRKSVSGHGAGSPNRVRRTRFVARAEPYERRNVPAIVFSGNVLSDFPATAGTGVKLLTGGPVDQPIVPPDLQGVITKTGFEVEGEGERGGEVIAHSVSLSLP